MQLLVRSIVVSIALMLVATVAIAGPLDKPKSPEARQHLNKGNALLNNAEFEKAVEEYKAGALIEDAPLFQYNIALAYRQLGNFEKAIWFYERFKSRAQPTGEMLDGINQLIDQMKAKLEIEKRTQTQPPTEPAPSADGSPDPGATSSSTTSANTNGIATSTAPARSPDWFGIGLNRIARPEIHA